MKLGDVLSLKSCKDGNELFLKVTDILGQYGIDVFNGDMSVKDLYTLCCDVAEVWNNNTK